MQQRETPNNKAISLEEAYRLHQSLHIGPCNPLPEYPSRANPCTGVRLLLPLRHLGRLLASNLSRRTNERRTNSPLWVVMQRVRNMLNRLPCRKIRSAPPTFSIKPTPLRPAQQISTQQTQRALHPKTRGRYRKVRKSRCRIFSLCGSTERRLPFRPLEQRREAVPRADAGKSCIFSLCGSTERRLLFRPLEQRREAVPRADAGKSCIFSLCGSTERRLPFRPLEQRREAVPHMDCTQRPFALAWPKASVPEGQQAADTLMACASQQKGDEVVAPSTSRGNGSFQSVWIVFGNDVSTSNSAKAAFQAFSCGSARQTAYDRKNVARRVSKRISEATPKERGERHHIPNRRPSHKKEPRLTHKKEPRLTHKKEPRLTHKKEPRFIATSLRVGNSRNRGRRPRHTSKQGRSCVQPRAATAKSCARS